MPNYKPYFIALLIFMMATLSYDIAMAQTPSAGPGTANGQVRDSADLGVLPQATIAIYRARDTSLLKYQLSDLRGRFVVTGLPVDSNLLLMVNYVGYRAAMVKFKIPSAEKEITLPRVLMAMGTSALKEVTIRVPPIELRGDTVIFHADAFKTRKNAVIGDLMRDLPGFVIWGDGKMEVNGKSVSNVTVEGKTFFANDPRIALSNIPKTAVDQVQVIKDKDIDRANGDTAKTVSVNIKLKKNARSGAFGKIGYGYGTDGRREGDASISAFTPKDQLTIAGNLNNTNRNTMSTEMMMILSSYRSGQGHNLLYNNFDRNGITDQRTAGLIYNRFWNKDIKTYTNYDINRGTTTVIRNTFNNTLLGDSSQISNRYSSSVSNNSSNTFRTQAYLRDSSFNTGDITVNTSTSHSDNTSVDSVINLSTNRFLNRTTGSSNSRNNNNNLNLTINFQHRYDARKHNYRPSKEDFDLKYELSRNSNDGDRNRINSLTNAAGTTSNINRRWDQNGTSYNHALAFNYDGLAGLFKLYNTYGFRLQNELRYYTGKGSARADDFSATTNSYSINNQYLTNTNQLDLLNYRPSISYTKSFTKNIAGRFIKTLSITGMAKGQFISQDNRSDKNFRNINKQYNSFIPQASISYTDNLVGARRWWFELNYQTSSDIPSIDQLAPLIDSTQQDQYFVGNRKLKPYYEHDLELSYNWKQETTYPLSFRAAVKATGIENYISDSSSYNSSGIRTSAPVNVNGFRNYSADMRVAKAFVVNKKQFTFVLNGNAFSRNTPLYVNAERVNTLSRSVNFNSELGYTYSTTLAIYWLARYGITESRYAGSATPYQNTAYGSGFEAMADLTNGLHLNTSARIDVNKAANLPSTHLLIWNAYLSYRVGKKQNYEVKFSANDILNQSQGVRNTVNDNVISLRQTNSLQQYFLVGLAYYPRFFGGGK